MNLLKKYTSDQLAPEELEQTSDRLLNKLFDRELKSTWSDRLAREQGIQREVVHMPTRRRSYRWLAAAAAAVLLGLVGWLWLPVGEDDPRQLADGFLVTPFPNSEVRKDASEVDAQRMLAIQAYNEGDFKTAAQQREAIIEAGEQVEKEDLFYLGLSYLYQAPAQPGLAATYLQAALQHPAPRLQAEARWFLALAYVKAAKYEQARPLLEAIAAEGGWQAREAAALLQAVPG